MCNALWRSREWMHNNVLVVYINEPCYDKIISLLVKNLSEKILNYCKLIPKAINVLEKVFFGSVSLRPW